MNASGLHARPANAFVKEAVRHAGCNILIKKDGKTLPEAKPDSGYAFVGWDTTGDGAADYADNESLKNAEVSGELTVKPVYVPAYNVKFTSGPNGSISGRDAFAVLDRAGSAVLGNVVDVDEILAHGFTTSIPG